MGNVQSVNIGRLHDLGPKLGRSAIDKRPTSDAVWVRAPGPRKGFSGLVDDEIGSARHHGGDNQAVYAYAREDLDRWATELDRSLSPGMFGENLTTIGVAVTNAVIGEHWAIGPELVLQVSLPRIPCNTFAAWMGVPQWVRTFTERGWPGAYLRVLRPGPVRGGDEITVTDRPDHGITIGVTFRALMGDREALELLLTIDDLPEELHERARRRLAPAGVE